MEKALQRPLSSSQAYFLLNNALGWSSSPLELLLLVSPGGSNLCSTLLRNLCAGPARGLGSCGCPRGRCLQASHPFGHG